MKLEQMRQIATELGTGELPPLAGAGGLWLLPIGGATRQGGASSVLGGATAIFAQLKTNGAELALSSYPVTGTEVSPLGVTHDSPTKMQEWHFGNIRIPVFAFLQVTEIEAEIKAVAFAATVTVSILIDGEPLFIQTVELPLQPSPLTVAAKASGGAFANSTIVADLNNPLIFEHGRRLGLKVDASLNQPVGKSIQENAFAAVLGVTGSIAANGARVENVNFGSMAYTVQSLSGHRVLS